MTRIFRFFIVLAVFAAALPSQAATTASDILDAMRTKFASAKAVEVKFTMGEVQGEATLSGASFMFRTPQMSVWYDGQTQWAYLQSSGEVNITEPTPDEVSASNPFAILNSYHKSYKARRLADSGGCYQVELTPLSRGSIIARIVVSCSIKTKWPASISITFDDSRRIDLKVDSIKAVPAVPVSVFRYDAKRFPASEIIDLR